MRRWLGCEAPQETRGGRAGALADRAGDQNQMVLQTILRLRIDDIVSGQSDCNSSPPTRKGCMSLYTLRPGGLRAATFSVGLSEQGEGTSRCLPLHASRCCVRPELRERDRSR